MKRDEVIQKLRKERRYLQDKFGVESLALFGSVARDEAGPDSDIDVLVEFARPITLFDLVAVQQYLERCLGVSRGCGPAQQRLPGIPQQHPGRGGACLMKENT